jgi:hypothetical protein
METTQVIGEGRGEIRRKTQQKSTIPYELWYLKLLLCDPQFTNNSQTDGAES